MGNGITFILSLLLLFFTGVGWPGLPLLTGHWKGLGGQSGSPLLWLPLDRESGSCQGILFILGCRYSHHLPEVDGRFLGRRGGGEMVLVLLWPRAGGLSHLPGVSGHRRGSDSSGLLLGISRTTGGRSARGMREVAAASGGSAPTSNATSGNAARGGVWAGSGLSFTAILATELASLKGSVICQFLLRARQGDPEK